MQILLDARKLGDGGIGVYLQNLVDGLLALREAGELSFELTLLVAPTLLAKSSNASVASPRWSGIEYVAERAKKYSFTEYFLLAGRHRQRLSPQSLFVSPHYTLPFGLPCASVVTVHDCIHLSHPSRFWNPSVARLLIGSALRRATRAITVSNFSRAELARYFPAAKVDVVPNGCKPIFRERFDERKLAEARLRLGVSAPYCLFVGNAKVHKGFAELYEAWRLVSLEFGDQRPQLVVVGSFSATQRTAAVASFGERGVKFLSGLSVEELAALTQGAVASLLPSQIEGFGLPALEALAMGTPVVASPAPALREVCEEHAWYASDFSGRAFAEAISKLIRDPHGAALKAERGRQRSLRFSNERMARESWAVYCGALGVANGAAAARSLRGAQ